MTNDLINVKDGNLQRIVCDYNSEKNEYRYYSLDGKPLNFFIKEMRIKYKSGDSIVNVFYKTADNYEIEIIEHDIVELIKDDSSCLCISNEGFIVIYNKDMIVATLNFKSYDIMYISQILDMLKLRKGRIISINNNNILIANGRNQIIVPFIINIKIFNTYYEFRIKLK